MRRRVGARDGYKRDKNHSRMENSLSTDVIVGIEGNIYVYFPLKIFCPIKARKWLSENVITGDPLHFNLKVGPTPICQTVVP